MLISPLVQFAFALGPPSYSFYHSYSSLATQDCPHLRSAIIHSALSSIQSITVIRKSQAYLYRQSPMILRGLGQSSKPPFLNYSSSSHALHLYSPLLHKIFMA